jgi:hypothetical protein
MHKNLANLKAYGRFYMGLRSFLRDRISLAEAEAIIRQNMAARDTNFLRLMERGIFGYPESPYLPLLKLAGCELGDIHNMVQTKGLEATLRKLREAGVYATFEEFKGRKPIVRNGKVFNVQPRHFDNPYLRRHYDAASGGTTGKGTRVAVDLDHLATFVPHLILEHHIQSGLKAPLAVWFGTLPDPTGINSILIRSRYGSVPAKWFSPVSDQSPKSPLKSRLVTQGILMAGRLYGVPLPRPEPVSLDQAAIIARWAAKTVSAHGACLITTHTSQALRICIAALEEGLDLNNVTISGGGEPPSAAKVKTITRSGARWVPKYITVEAGPVGMGCAQPLDENDMHFLKDALALIQYPRQVPGAEITVQAFHFTSLLPAAPKLLLNVESDDYGIVETRACGCPFEAHGYTEHLRKIQSFRKLTGEGVTLVGSDMLHILEEVLPSRFGGSPLDYQLLEEENQQGFTRLSLLVNPEIQIENESAIIKTIIETLKRKVGQHQALDLWKQAETLRVKRQKPILTARGKFVPLHKSKWSTRQTGDESF